MTDWLILTATLPTHPSGLRVRVWRALKATGAASLREGVYVLPATAPSAAALRAIEAQVIEAGAQAHLLEVRARDEAQEQAFRALFDRAEHYAEWMASARQARKSIGRLAEAPLRKALRTLEQQLLQIQAGDFFPGPAQQAAARAFAELAREIELHLSPGEPASQASEVEPRDAADFQGRTWATRKRPWVDRLATAWLVRRFIDRQPKFVWLSDVKKCPKRAVGYDFDGATFTHVGERVTFEVVARAFGLDASPAIRRLGELVHYVDVGGPARDEAPGLELLVRGLQAQHADDDALLQAACALFDTLHAALQASDER